MKFRASFISVTVISFLIFVSSFVFVYKTKQFKLTLQSEDFLAISTIPFSIVKEGNFDLDEYYQVLSSNYPQPDDPTETPYYLKKIGTHYYSNYPMFASFISLPFYILPSFFIKDVDIETIRIMSRLAGSALTALSVGFFFLLAQNRLKSKKYIILLTVVYAFATNTLSTSSQGLWQQTSSQLLFTAGLLLLDYKRYGLSGLIFGFSYMARPTNILSAGIFSLYILWIHRTNFSKLLQSGFVYGLGSIIPIILDTFLNKYLFGSILNIEYGDRFSEFSENLLTGTTGLWLSPGKGILVFSPVLIFIFYGIFYYLKKSKKYPLEVAMITILILHTLVLGKWYAWYGGYCWGYRMMTEMIPYMVLMLIPFIKSKYFEKSPYKQIFWLTLIYSLFIQFLGILMFDGVWHTLYDGKPGWLWSIENSQIVFSVKRLLARYKLISFPYPK